MDLDYGSFQNLVEEKKQLLLNSAKMYISGKNYETIKKAIDVASFAHFQQRRKSGEPYITHPLAVAKIITEWRLDFATICGAVLHDVVEDTLVTKEDLVQIFGNEIAELVDSVTKIQRLHFESDEVAHAEYFRKVVLAMARDIRVILIKLADRLHNILTLSSMSPEKRKKTAIETMEIYVPIANRIGLHKLHLQLADECFKYIYPYRYKVLLKAVDIARQKKISSVEKILLNISDGLKSNGIVAKFVYRQRGIYNLYQRMLRRHQSFNRIYDIFEIKIIVKTIRDCYLTLGVLHSIYQPLPNKFKDHIAIPKSNGYQSLHSTLMGPHGTPLQLHIRTEAMDEIAEEGIISHWLKHKDNQEFLFANQRTTSWLNHIIDIQSGSFSAYEFLESVKKDLLHNDIFVFTPKGKIILLPNNATAIDFAYFIHSDIGNHAYCAKVNQKIVKLPQKLKNGDIIEIITKPEVEPEPEWLGFAVSGRAVSKIKHYLKEQKYDEDIAIGKELLNTALIILGISKEITTENLNALLGKVIAKYYIRLTDMDELFHLIRMGEINALNVAQQIMMEKFNKLYNRKEPVNIYLSNCKGIKIVQDPECLGIPGENLVLQLNKQGELIIHQTICKQINLKSLDNLTFAHIINDVGMNFLARIEVLISNVPGMFTKFARIVAKDKINIEQLKQDHFNQDFALIRATLRVNSIFQLEKLFINLSKCNIISKFHKT